MSRSGYSEDCDSNYIYLYRSVVGRAIAGKRGQAFLREMVAALDAMPEKRLIADALEHGGEVCALGSVGAKRGIDMTKMDAHDPDALGVVFGIARALAAEIEYENDEEGFSDETPGARWQRMRRWASKNLRAPSTSEQLTEKGAKP